MRIMLEVCNENNIGNMQVECSWGPELMGSGLISVLLPARRGLTTDQKITVPLFFNNSAVVRNQQVKLLLV